MKTYLLLFALFSALCGVILPVAAQINVQSGDTSIYISDKGGINVNTGSTEAAINTVAAAVGSETDANIGNIESTANVQGITIINGRVYIDGEEIPNNVTSYKSPRTGEVYTIRRDMGSVSVVSATETKR